MAALTALFLLSFSPHATTVVFEGRASEVTSPRVVGEELHIAPADLARVTGFDLKPEGACRGAICVPLKKPGSAPGEGELVGPRGFHLTALARRLDQRWLHETPSRTGKHDGAWVFGKIPMARRGFSDDAQAPDLEIARAGSEAFQLVKLKGTRALLLTWASW